ncbi:uncharacterized protein LOC106872169 isoform X1 [Octopus bimaculoides]|uniref:CUB domain-containing protein n=1 Tax=Octopus bimaculoides TaxID=37653 RepID=A0A0L8HA04_OCTBM|nr:uncharacterized protein LOC106872169 isoform X1 [Octopus bimaculoides]|eukprot:XP_014774538.1 PREDICTED: uncharacterized protein LOC106872169 isoform X1 [Octopus bimaculoides]
MRNYLLIIQIAGILTGVVQNKVTNMCRGNNPRCDKGKSIEIDTVTCPSPVNKRLWMQTKSEIYTKCENVKECDINFISSVSACCGTQGQIKKPRLRFVYDCPTMNEGVAKNATMASKKQNFPTTTKQTATTSKSIPVSTPRHESVSNNVLNPKNENFPESGFCEADICYEKPYCSIGSKIAIRNYTNNGEQNWKIMGMIRYYCNKGQNCAPEFSGYTQKICRPDAKNVIQYICMKEKITHDVDCPHSHVISTYEGHIISIDYPKMMPPTSSVCNFKIAFSEAVPIELFLLDGKNIRVQIINKNDIAITKELDLFHTILGESFEIDFEINPDNLREKRFWIYYRTLTTDDVHSKPALPWIDTCPETIEKKTTQIQTTDKIKTTSEINKDEIAKSDVSNKDLPPTRRSEIFSKSTEVTDSTVRMVPALTPVQRELKTHKTAADGKMEVTFSTTETSHVAVITNKHHETGDMDSTEKNSVRHTSVSSQTGMFGKEIITGLIAGIVILACLVIILLTALIASMKRRRRCLAANTEREERSSSEAINEPLASFQYLKENFGEGDNETLNGRSKNSENNLLDDSKTGSNSKQIKKKSSLISSGNESGKTMDSATSKDDNVFQFSKTGDEFPESDYSTQEKNKYPDMGTMKIGDNTFTGRKNSDADILTRKDSQESKGDDDVFRDLQHFYVNGDDYALVKKDTRTSKSGFLSDNTTLVPKSNSSGSMHDSDVLEWTKGFNLAV